MKRKHCLALVVSLLLMMNFCIFVIAETNQTNEEVVVSLSAKSIQVQKGKVATLVATSSVTAKEDKPIFKWESSNKKIATVQGGKVRGVSAGTAQITVYLLKGKESIGSAVCDVEVVIPVSSLSLKKKSITLEMGSTFEPEVIVSPKNATNPLLRWTSDNPRVATVQKLDGIISAVGCGECIISATTVDGSEKIVKLSVFVPGIYANKKEVKFEYFPFTPEIIEVEYYIPRQNLEFNDNDAMNEWYFIDFKNDNKLELRIWPFRSGTSTITIRDKQDKRNTIKIRVDNKAGLNDPRVCIPLHLVYKSFMRDNTESGDWYNATIRVKQVWEDGGTYHILGYSRQQYEDLVYIRYSLKEKHDWVDRILRPQEDDMIEAWFRIKGVFSYQTVQNSTAHALELIPYMMFFQDTAELFYVRPDVFK